VRLGIGDAQHDGAAARGGLRLRGQHDGAVAEAQLYAMRADAQAFDEAERLDQPRRGGRHVGIAEHGDDAAVGHGTIAADAGRGSHWKPPVSSEQGRTSLCLWSPLEKGGEE
jgi:hypothetical protein